MSPHAQRSELQIHSLWYRYREYEKNALDEVQVYRDVKVVEVGASRENHPR